MSKAERNKAIRKLEIAIDKLVDFQDLGGGSPEITSALEILNAELNKLRSTH